MKLAGKTALVTGAGRGIGFGCALQIAKAGARLIINDRIGSTDLADAARQIEETGQACTPIEADVFSRSGCEGLVAEAIQQAGPIDILVSNPAYGVRTSFLDYDPDDFQEVVNGTLTGGFHMSQLVARHLVERESPGKIILISSVQAEMPMARSVAYSAAKAALNQVARTAAVELSPYHINVNSIQPGWIETPGEHISFGSERIAEEGPKLPWGRLGTPDDIGKAAAFLASDDADYITGTVLTVDGGFRWKDCRHVPPTSE